MKYPRIMVLLGIVFGMIGLGFVLTPAANATTAQDCTTSTDTSGNTVTVCETKAEATFSVDESTHSKAHLSLVDAGHVFLTVQVHPMKPRQIVGQCKTLKVGTAFWNGFVNPMTGAVKFKHWHVQAGDRVFCLGHDHQWHKKSCGNPVRGKSFHTPAPPKRQRVTGKVHIVDYATWKAHMRAIVHKHLAGSVSVTSADGRCNASASLDNDINVGVWLSAKFKSRFIAQALTQSTGSITQTASTSQKVKGALAAAIKVVVDNKLSAMCSSVPPPPNYSAPSVSASAEACVKQGETTGVIDATGVNPNDVAAHGTFTLGSQSKDAGSVPANSSASVKFTGLAPGTYKVIFALGAPVNLSDSTTVTVNQCDTPVVPAPDVTLNTMNQVIETKSATTGLAVQVYGGDTATVTIATLWGQITTTKTFNSVSGSWNTTIGYTAPGEIPDGSQSFPDTPPPPAGYDQVHVVVVDNQTGKKVVAYTNVKITAFVPAP